MEFKVTITKEGAHWMTEVRELSALTQGATKKEAFFMMKDLLGEMLFDHFEKKIGVKSKTDSQGNSVFIISDQYALPLILKRLRSVKGKTIQEVSDLCGFKSKNSYAQYEQGRRMPGIEQFIKLLEVMGAELRISRVQEHK